MEIENRAFFVTGGGSGLGAATARMLAEAGCNVVLADVNDEAGEGVADELRDKARFVRAAVTDEGSVRAALDVAREAFGSLHGLVNCAAWDPPRRCSAGKARTRWRTSRRPWGST